MEQSQTVFDLPRYLQLIEARGGLIRRLVPELKAALGLNAALDSGCGPGFFAQILQDWRSGSGRRSDGARRKMFKRRSGAIPKFLSSKVTLSTLIFFGWVRLILCSALGSSITSKTVSSRFETPYCSHRQRASSGKACASPDGKAPGCSTPQRAGNGRPEPNRCSITGIQVKEFALSKCYTVLALWLSIE